MVDKLSNAFCYIATTHLHTFSVLCVLYIVSWTALKVVYLHTFFTMIEQSLLRSPRARMRANVQRCKKEAGHTPEHTHTQKKKLPEARGPAELEIGVSGATTAQSCP